MNQQQLANNAGRVGQQIISDEFYIYSTGRPAAALAVGGTSTLNISIQADSDFLIEKLSFNADAAGATQTWKRAPGKSLSGGQHQAGTCRMGNDPKTSVVDRNCRLHDADNVFVIDASVHVTNGGFNPALTILANAYRASANLHGIRVPALRSLSRDDGGWQACRAQPCTSHQHLCSSRPRP